MGLFQNKIIVLMGGGVLAALLVWYVFLRETAPQPLLQKNDLTAASASDKDVVETLLALRAITLSGTIFSDAAFLQLKDTGTQIIPEPVGRPNPFLPLGATTSVSTTTSSEAPER